MPRARCCVLVIALAVPIAALAQPGRDPAVRSEVRVDAIFARVTLLQAGVGAAFRTGYNLRLHVAAAGGVALKGGEEKSSARGDATLRLLLDPFGESRNGVAIGGGVSVLHDGFEKTRPVGLIVLGLEGSPRAPIVWAAEAALGGGVRVGIVLRRRAGRYR
jgi:hypothetical protein